MRGIIWLMLLAVYQLAIACTTPLQDQPIDTTLGEIRADVWKFHEKLVRVRGVFNECISFSCEFCPTYESHFENRFYFEGYWQNHPNCMGVAFGGDVGDNLEAIGGTRSSRTRNQLAALQEEAARLTDSTIVAVYDAACSQKPLPENHPNYDPENEIISVCTDRAPELRDARLEDVHTRYTGAKGPFTVYGIEEIEKAMGETEKALLQSFVDQVQPLDEKRAYFSFVQKDNASIGGVCECFSNDCIESDWPKQIAGTWNFVPANPYTCWQASNSKGSWAFEN